MANRVLAIDDEAGLLSVIEETAQSVGFEASVTTDPDVFKSSSVADPPDLIMLDLQMPVCDGVELLRYLADQQCQATIVLMSGFDARVLAITRTMGMELGLTMGEPLYKPIRVAELRQLFAAIQDTHFEINVPAIREALNLGQFQLHYQPLVSLADRQPVGWEALIRWVHPRRGLIMPDRFIAVAEQDTVIDAITEFVVRTAVTQMADWRRQGYEPSVAVNLSARNLADATLPDHAVDLCNRYEIAKDRLCFELTETAAMKDPLLMTQILTRLRLKGFRLAIDDFGSGYSSLIQLYRLPFTEIKIDQKFVGQMLQSEEANVIVGAIVNLAHSLRLQLIAEGIESEQVVGRLVDLGCERGQGYYFGKPMPPQQAFEWAKARAATG